MKLYTEEQVRKAIDFFLSDETQKNKIIETLTPIELPSDEEIEEGLFHQSNEYAYGYKDAFKYIKEQIHNQNK